MIGLAQRKTSPLIPRKSENQKKGTTCLSQISQELSKNLSCETVVFKLAPSTSNVNILHNVSSK